MTIAGGINRLLGMILDVLKQIPRGRIWLWLLIYFVINWAVLYVHYNFSSPVFYWLFSLWAKLFPEQQAIGFTHYPGQFLLLPYFFDWARIAVGLILEGMILGAAALLFYECYVEVPEDDRVKIRSLLPSWIHMILAYAVITGLMLVVNYGVTKVASEWLAGSPRRILFYEWIVMPGIYVVIMALLFYMFASIALYRDNIIQAIGRTLRTCFRNPITSLILAAIMLVGPVIMSNMLSNPRKIVDNFNPELVYWILVVALVVDTLAYFFWMGASVRLLVDEED